MTTFIRLLTEKDKASHLLASCAALRSNLSDERAFDVPPESFRSVPGAPFAYWVSQAVRDLFERMPALESDYRTAKQGLATAGDFRFVRVWWETQGKSWYGFAKGGAYSPIYADVYLLVNWSKDGDEIKSNLNENGGVRSNIWMLRDTAVNFFCRPGLTWPRRTNGLSFRIMPRGCIFADKGPAAFVKDDNPDALLALCAIATSQAFNILVSVQLARAELAQSFEVGLIQQTPVPELDSEQQALLAELALDAWSIKRTIDTTTEISHAFVLPAALRIKVEGLNLHALNEDLAHIQAKIDSVAFELYGIGEIDRTTLQSITVSDQKDNLDGNEIAIDDTDDEETDPAVDQDTELLSWAVGVAFGRFDLRLATGERPIPPHPAPFDPLPEKSPGMLPDGSEPFYRHPGFLVDDPGHPHDLAQLVEDVLVSVDNPVMPDVRRQLQRDFFPFHLKRYSKSRRKAPIYWQFATSSGRYSFWLYGPGVNIDTFFRLQQDVLDPKIAKETRALDGFSQRGRDLSASERLEIENQGKLVEELTQLADEVKRVAPLWKPNLNDGTVLVMAPLWRMVGHHKQWQKELRTRWEELQAGKHDWSHQAMHLWPERVIPKCAEDRSLAIAHGLEDVFWFEPESGKWAKRDVPKRPIAEIVRERTSDAVKAALKELLEAPEPAAAGGRSRRKA